MTLIDADKFLGYLIYSKHIDSLLCIEVKDAVEMCKVDVLEQIRAEIIQMNSLDYVEPISCEEVLEIIDKYR